MPDLNAKASYNYWKNYSDPMILRVLCAMESIEAPKDNNSLFRVMLYELGKTLEQAKNVNFNQLDQREVFIILANHLNMPQTLYLLQVINTIQPGAASQLLLHAENITKNPSDPAGIFLQRNLTFERLRLLARIFSEERLHIIHQALTNIE